MARIIVIANMFKDKWGKEELLIDYAFNEATLEAVILPCVEPTRIGAIFDSQIREYVLEG